MVRPRNRGHELERRCDEVLHYVWDPIGVSDEPRARDEYSSYVPNLCGLLRRGGTEAEIVRYLDSAVGDAMGLKPDTERSMKVAALLIRWRDRLDEGPITETDFWQRLEFRLCREMAGNREWAALGLWCDGIRPDTIGLDSTPQIIEGKAWVGIGPNHQEEWSFGMVLPTRVEHRSQIDWDALLPPDDVTGWMSVDRERRRLELEPGLAIRDEA